MPKQEHEFGNSAFGRTVVAADNAGFEQMQSGFVASHLNTAALALGNVDNDDASFCCVLQLPDEPVLLRCIAGTECLENHCFQSRNVKYRIDDAFLNTRKQGEDYDIGVEKIMRLHRSCRVGATDDVFVVTDMDSCFCQSGVVERAESVEIFGIDFGCPVAAHQFIFKEDAHFGDKGCAVRTFGGSYFDGSNQIFFSVRAQCPDG